MKDSLLEVIRSWEIDAEKIASKLFLGVVILILFYFIAKISKTIFIKLNSKLLQSHPDLLAVLSKIIYSLFVFWGYFIFLRVIGLEQYVTKVLAGAGIVGIIAGFALKDIASNAFSGLLLFIKKPYKDGDWVQIDGHYGKVLLIGWLTTTVENLSGQEVSVSNQLIYSSAFINYSKLQKRRICLQADVSGYSDLPNLKKILNDKIQTFDELLPNGDIQLFVISIGESGEFTFQAMYWIEFNDGFTFRSLISKAIVGIQDVAKQNTINIKNISWISDEEDGSSSGKFGLG